MGLSLEKISGNQLNFTLEHRFLNVVLIIGVIIFLIGNIENYLFELSSTVILVHFIGSFIFGYMYYLSRIKKVFKIPLSILSTLLILFVFPASWVSNGGSFGGIPFYMMCGISFFAIILKKRMRTAAVCGMLVSANVLILLEYMYPSNIIGYNSSFSRYADVAFAFNVSMIVNAGLISVLAHQYKSEHEKAKFYIAKAERQKAILEKQSYIRKLNIELKQEIDARIKAQEACRAADEKFSKAFDISPVPMCILSTKPLRFVEINTSMINTFGEDLLTAKSKIMKKLMTPKQYLSILRSLREHGKINKMETTFYDKSGAVLSGLLSVEKINIAGEIFLLCIWYDITKLKNMQAEMKKLDRLNIIGKMAAGLGHEIRNPMTTVRGFLQFMGQKAVGKDREYFKLIIAELDRANSIITEFLLMAADRVINFQLIDMNKIITNIIPLIEADAYKEGHSFTFNAGQIPMLLADANEISQMVLNLARNGIEAMKAKGRLLITTYREKDNVVLKVSDEGTGIDPEIINQLGTPFVTTKNEGTGLGLAICYSIANRHNADVMVESSKQGTTFYIKFKIMANMD